MITTTFIYGLVDPRNGSIRYVGKADDPERRLFEHSTCKAAGHKRNWIALLKRMGLKPQLVYLCRVHHDKWEEMEKFQIAFFRSRGMADLNYTDGGDGVAGYKFTEEDKLKISNGVIGRRFTEDHKRKIGAANMGRVVTTETRAKISKAMAGRVLTESHKQKIAKGSLGRKHTPETIVRMKEAQKGNKHWLGRKHTAKTRAKMRLSSLARSMQIQSPPL